MWWSFKCVRYVLDLLLLLVPVFTLHQDWIRINYYFDSDATLQISHQSWTVCGKVWYWLQ